MILLNTPFSGAVMSDSVRPYPARLRSRTARPEHGYTQACIAYDHARCSCLLPGQDRRFAGLMLAYDEELDEFVPCGICVCMCHTPSLDFLTNPRAS